MQIIETMMKQKAKELLNAGKVSQVIAWRRGEFFYDNAPAYFRTAEETEDLSYNAFCGSNLTKYLIANTKKDEKTAVFLKPCDTYSLNQLLKDRRVKREMVYVIGIPCAGMVDVAKLKAQAGKGLLRAAETEEEILVSTAYGDRAVKRAEVLLRKCETCKGSVYAVSDETLGEPFTVYRTTADSFAAVKAIESLDGAERFAFWQQELSKCIRCNACRDACPSCSCEQCIFDDPESVVAGKVSNNSAEEQLFHIIRAYHVAGRCTDCGECGRVCPQGIRLDLLNRKLIKDINELYGEYRAGADAVTASPLLHFEVNDVEPGSTAKGSE